MTTMSRGSDALAAAVGGDHLTALVATAYGTYAVRKPRAVARWARVDAVLIATAHDSVNYKELASWAPVIIDTRNAMAGIETKQGQVWKA